MAIKNTPLQLNMAHTLTNGVQHDTHAHTYAHETTKILVHAKKKKKIMILVIIKLCLTSGVNPMHECFPTLFSGNTLPSDFFWAYD